MLNPADDAFAARLAAVLPEGTVRPAAASYLEEPRGKVRLDSGWVVLPRSAAEVAAIVRFCSDASVGIVPYGGGTGLVQGQISDKGPAALILSTERMAKVRAVYPGENVLIAEAGVTLAEVQAAAEGAGRLFPLSLASEGTARIGGNLATNAGGVNVLRYGNARDLCLGVEAVLADGTLLSGLRRLRKDNTGYDLRNLLIGSEGTLGIITAASLRLFARPAAVGTAMLEVRSPADALSLLRLAQDMTAEGVTAFELMARQGLLFLDEVVPDVRQPFAHRPDWTVLIEISVPPALDPSEVLGALFEAAAERGWVSDGLIAESLAQRQAFWTVREMLPEANKRIGAVSSHDVSLPLSELPRFLERAPAVVAALGPYRINAFGHLGDGNLHYNAFPPKGAKASEFADRAGAVRRAVHDLVDELGGSVSAEHGIGRLKVDDLERYGDAGRLEAMRRIKHALDPKGILNPGAVLRL